MADTTLTPGAAVTTPACGRIEAPRRVLFEPFSWHRVGHESIPLPGARVADFAVMVRDVAAGVQTVLEIAHTDDVDAGCADEHGETLPSLLGTQAANDLARLSIAALGMLAEEAERMWEFVGERAAAAEGAAHVGRP